MLWESKDKDTDEHLRLDMHGHMRTLAGQGEAVVGIIMITDLTSVPFRVPFRRVSTAL